MGNKIKAERKPIRYLFRATKTVNGVKYYAKDYGKNVSLFQFMNNTEVRQNGKNKVKHKRSAE